MKLGRTAGWGLELAREHRRELAALVLLLLVAGGIWIFVELADEVLEGETHAFDRAVLLALRHPQQASDPLGPGWVEEMARDFTALGGVGVLTLLVLAVAGLMALRRQVRVMVFVLASIVSGLVVSSLLKVGFDRPRPELVPHESIVYTASFPSGHSTLAALTYLTLGALLARLESQWSVKLYLLSWAILLSLLVGVSRVYLGVHWPTDVLAGWTLGAAWALLSWFVALWLQRRRRIETSPATTDRTSLGP